MRSAIQRIGLCLVAGLGVMLLAGCPAESTITETPNNGPGASSEAVPPAKGAAGGAATEPAAKPDGAAAVPTAPAAAGKTEGSSVTEAAPNGPAPEGGAGSAPPAGK